MLWEDEESDVVEVTEECDAMIVEKPPSPQFKLGSQYRTLYRQLQQNEVSNYSSHMYMYTVSVLHIF